MIIGAVQVFLGSKVLFVCFVYNLHSLSLLPSLLWSAYFKTKMQKSLTPVSYEQDVSYLRMYFTTRVKAKKTAEDYPASSMVSDIGGYVGLMVRIYA